MKSNKVLQRKTTLTSKSSTQSLQSKLSSSGSTPAVDKSLVAAKKFETAAVSQRSFSEGEEIGVCLQPPNLPPEQMPRTHTPELEPKPMVKR